MDCEKWTIVLTVFEWMNETGEQILTETLTHILTYLTRACTVLAHSVGEEPITTIGCGRG